MTRGKNKKSLKFLCDALSVGSLCRNRRENNKEYPSADSTTLVEKKNNNECHSPKAVLERKVTTPLTDASGGSQSSDLSSGNHNDHSSAKQQISYSTITRKLAFDRKEEEEEAIISSNEKKCQTDNNSNRERSMSSDYLTDEEFQDSCRSNLEMPAGNGEDACSSDERSSLPSRQEEAEGGTFLLSKAAATLQQKLEDPAGYDSADETTSTQDSSNKRLDISIECKDKINKGMTPHGAGPECELTLEELMNPSEGEAEKSSHDTSDGDDNFQNSSSSSEMKTVRSFKDWSKRKVTRKKHQQLSKQKMNVTQKRKRKVIAVDDEITQDSNKQLDISIEDKDKIKRLTPHVREMTPRGAGPEPESILEELVMNQDASEGEADQNSSHYTSDVDYYNFQNSSSSSEMKTVRSFKDWSKRKVTRKKQQQQLSSKQQTKNTTKKRERKLIQTWDLLWHDGSRTGRYTGSAVILSLRHVAHGYGKLAFFNGDLYEGPFYDGAMHGKHAIYKTKNGTKYYGTFEQNHQHGFGEYLHHDGSSYIGRYDRGRADGFGIQYNPDGSVFYRGKWSKGVPILGGKEKEEEETVVSKRSSRPVASDITTGAVVRKENANYDSDSSHSERKKKKSAKAYRQRQPKVMNPPIEMRVSKSVSPYQITNKYNPSEAFVTSFSDTSEDESSSDVEVVMMRKPSRYFAVNLPLEVGISLSSSEDDSDGVSIYDPNYHDVLKRRQATRHYTFSSPLLKESSLSAVIECSGSEREGVV